MTHQAVFGILQSSVQTDALIHDLRQSGFANRDISVLFPDTKGSRDYAFQKGTKAPEGALVGVGAGGAVGGTLGLLAGLGLLAIPGIGPFIAAGPIMAALSGITVGAAIGSFSGAMVGLGIPEVQAKLYEDKLKAGSILVSVHTLTGEQVTLAKAVLERHGAKDISTTSEVPTAPEPRSPSAFGATTGG